MIGVGTKRTWLCALKMWLSSKLSCRLQDPVLQKHLSESRKQGYQCFQVGQERAEAGSLWQPAFKLLKKNWQVNKILKILQGTVV